MFLSFIHIWNILHLQQIKGMQSLNLGVWRASPYKTLLSTPTSPPGPPHPRTPRAVSWIESHPVSRTAHKCLIRFFLSDYFSVFHCVMGLRLNLSLAEIWQKCYLFAEKLPLRWGWKGSWERWQSTNWSCAVLSLFAIAVREFFQVSNKMPDYLGKDQRKIKDDEKKDDKPIQGASDTLNHTKSRRDLLVTRLTSFSLRLHMETRIQIFH